MKTSIHIFFIILVLILIPPTLPAFELTYGFFYQTDREEIKTIDYTEGRANLNPGDLVKLYFKTDECVYLYVILEDARGDMVCIVPRVFNDCRGNSPIIQGLYIPDDLRWFPPVKGIGNETFYLIASVKRLIALEDLLKNFHKEKRVNPKSVQTLDTRQAVLKEIRTLMLEHFPLTRDIKSEIQVVAVTFRGDEYYSFPAEKVTVDNIFIKTVILSH
ncbi:MAG: DUF4384 domain-containing protein [Spirochaetales bacterium]|nr:DUF4384 domain-containing protein [Spirochaetales bacterium]